MKRILIALAALSLISTPAGWSQTRVQQNGLDQVNQASISNPVPVQVDVAGSGISASNPLPTQTSQGGAAISASNPLPTQLTNGTNTLNGLAPNASNALPVMNGNSTLATYAYSTGYFTPVATATDMVGIVGSASKTLKIQKLVLSGIQSTAGNNKFFLIKRSVADTGSTPSAVTAIPLDSANAAASGTVQIYTATNPTTGAAVGTIASPDVLQPAAATATGGATFVLFDSKVSGQPIVLRGIAEELDLNFAGAAIPSGMSLNLDILLTQE